MQVMIRQEAGYDLALYGMSLSFKDRSIKPEDWWDLQNKEGIIFPTVDNKKRKERMIKVATANANRGLGHNKFRRQIMLWLDIEAPRFWWSEFDTYKVGTVAQSESTMHTLAKRNLTDNDLELPEYLQKMSSKRAYVDMFNSIKGDLTIEELKALVPESYLQRRLVTLNYEVLATIINQRKNHKLPQWKVFIESIYKQVEHKELLPSYPYE